jgi:hypothetical protein
MENYTMLEWLDKDKHSTYWAQLEVIVHGALTAQNKVIIFSTLLVTIHPLVSYTGKMFMK